MADRYTVYQGDFVCHTCKENVKSLRNYVNSKKLTWLCSKGHMSVVSLQTKRTKRDYERTERE
jgi:hypothetical protein